MSLPSTEKPVTIDRIEAALDAVALIMSSGRHDGLTYLPIFRRLERELEDFVEQQRALERARDRAKAIRDNGCVKKSVV